MITRIFSNFFYTFVLFSPRSRQI